ncbi:MAG: hexokinase A, partial [Tremellales sp. Tagirdzhanova-0007]
MIVLAIEETLKKGLQEPGQVVPMIPTFVFGWPTGDEKGEYLALDLGGTNLRVCLVTLMGAGKFEVTQTKYRLTEEQKHEDGQNLQLHQNYFGADRSRWQAAAWIYSHYRTDLSSVLVPLLLRIDHGELIRWTKGFGAPNIEGRDNVPVDLVAIVNDTTGTLIASNYVDSNTKIAVIFGTGCNAAYMETAENIPKMGSIGLPSDQGMAINCEWGAFDSFEYLHLPRTKYDIIIDEVSNKPGEQACTLSCTAFEKLIAGLYLGEIFRLVLCELVDSGDLFLGQAADKLEKAYAFDTAYLSLMESDPTEELLTIIG